MQRRCTRLSGWFPLVVIASVPMGCDRPGESATGGGADSAFRVAVVVPGTTADRGWNYSAKEAAGAIEKELGLDQPVSFVENVEQSRRKPLLREYGRDGYALVICHGYEFHQVVSEIAPDFPKTLFVVSGYDRPDPQFGSIVYQLGEAAYLCGAMAARFTRTGHVAFIAAQQVPPVELCYQGFSNGFRKYAPDGGSVRPPVYIEGSHPWEDSAAAKEKTIALLRVKDPAPIDVLFQNADAASRGIFEAVEQQGDVFVFGCNRDQNDTTATRRVIASAVIHIDRAFVRLAREVRAGTYRPHVESETIASGVIECVPSPRLSTLVGEEIARKALETMNQAREDVLAAP